jgi:hypothetical protein
MSNPIKTVTSKIKKNPAPFIAAAAVAGAVVGAVVTRKVPKPHIYTLGHMHRELNANGFDILILPTTMCDKIAPMLTQ